MPDILNYYQVNPTLATSGQPSPQDFIEMAAAGYQVVINLAMPTSDDALPREAEIVTGTGMSYIHLPVVWEAPTVADIDMFLRVMQALAGKKVWVHCMMNMRVSCFVYLYQKHALGLPEEQARYPMKEIWQPNDIWQKLIDDFEDFSARR